MPRKGHPVFLCQNKMKPISVVAFMSSYNKKDRKKKKKELLRREKAARKSRYTKRMNREEKFYEKMMGKPGGKTRNESKIGRYLFR